MTPTSSSSTGRREKLESTGFIGLVGDWLVRGMFFESDGPTFVKNELK